MRQWSFQFPWAIIVCFLGIWGSSFSSSSSSSSSFSFFFFKIYGLFFGLNFSTLISKITPRRFHLSSFFFPDIPSFLLSLIDPRNTLINQLMLLVKAFSFLSKNYSRSEHRRVGKGFNSRGSPYP